MEKYSPPHISVHLLSGKWRTQRCRDEEHKDTRIWTGQLPLEIGMFIYEFKNHDQ
jgi:hypothetical protein